MHLQAKRDPRLPPRDSLDFPIGWSDEKLARREYSPEQAASEHL
jgi:hypothetical protein